MPIGATPLALLLFSALAPVAGGDERPPPQLPLSLSAIAADFLASASERAPTTERTVHGSHGNRATRTPPVLTSHGHGGNRHLYVDNFLAHSTVSPPKLATLHADLIKLHTAGLLNVRQRNRHCGNLPRCLDTFAATRRLLLSKVREERITRTADGTTLTPAEQQLDQLNAVAPSPALAVLVARLRELGLALEAAAASDVATTTTTTTTTSRPHHPNTIDANATFIMVARYDGDGSSYPRHNDRSLDDRNARTPRRFTALYYSDPHWTPAAGGQLRIWPSGRQGTKSGSGSLPPSCILPSSSASCDAAPPTIIESTDASRSRSRSPPPPPIDIEPKADRLVLIESGVDHEVLPIHEPRFTVAAWFYPPSNAKTTTTTADGSTLSQQHQHQLRDDG